MMPWHLFENCYADARPHTVVSRDRCHILFDLARQALELGGAWIECGVYQGGTAMILATVLRESGLNIPLHLFDTFQGMPETDPKLDIHQKGDFSNTDIQSVKDRLRSVNDEQVIEFHPGLIPDTFPALALGRISLAHIDVDIFKSTFDCCEFIYPRLVPGGFLLFDDYGFPRCPGAKKAVDEYFSHTPETPTILSTRQALVTKWERK